MFEVIQSETFKTWFDGLRDRQTKARIDARIRRAAHGNLGDFKNLDGGISEMRLDFGPGYRLYFTRTGPVVIILLCGGDKSTQTADIKRAIKLAKDWRK